MKTRPLQIADIKRLYSYDPDTGLIFSHTKGRHVGSLNAYGYLVLKMRENKVEHAVLAHRIAYALMTGEDVPKGHEIDHINRVPSDNRWVNLRLCSHRQNMVNIKMPRPKHNLPRGVYMNAHSPINPYKSKVRVKGKSIHIGSFKSVAEAKAAFDQRSMELFGEFFTPDEAHEAMTSITHPVGDTQMSEIPAMEDQVPVTDDEEIEAAIEAFERQFRYNRATKQGAMRLAIAAWRDVRRRKYGDI